MVINIVVNVRKLITLSRETLIKVAEYQQKNGLPSESEAIRQLIETGLQAHSEKELER